MGDLGGKLLVGPVARVGILDDAGLGERLLAEQRASGQSTRPRESGSGNRSRYCR